MPVIDIAERPGVDLTGKSRQSEDHVVVLDNAVALLDGATSPYPDMPSGGWYSGVLAEQIEREFRVRPTDNLDSILGTAIDTTARVHRLAAGNSPSSTVSMLRWTEENLEALVLADSPIVAFGRFGTDIIADNRLAELRSKTSLRTPADAARYRNVDGGFWVAEATSEAALNAVQARWRIREVDSVIMATDGVSIAVDEYGIFDWNEVRRLARMSGCEAVLDKVRTAESADPNRIRWPRPKRHDDQALALIEFAHP